MAFYVNQNILIWYRLSAAKKVPDPSELIILKSRKLLLFHYFFPDFEIFLESVVYRVALLFLSKDIKQNITKIILLPEQPKNKLCDLYLFKMDFIEANK